jgi:hypothetical protein
MHDLHELAQSLDHVDCGFSAHVVSPSSFGPQLAGWRWEQTSCDLQNHLSTRAPKNFTVTTAQAHAAFSQFVAAKETAW